MLKLRITARELLHRLHSDKAGEISFEYIIVTFAVVGAVAAVFGSGDASGAIGAALTTGLNKILALLTSFAP